MEKLEELEELKKLKKLNQLSKFTLERLKYNYWNQKKIKFNFFYINNNTNFNFLNFTFLMNFSIIKNNLFKIQLNSFFWLLNNLTETNTLYKYIKNDLFEYETKLDNIFNYFLFFKKSTFISFFIDNFIDTPSCFKNIKSFKRQSFKLPILKFINFLMRSGKKEKYSVILFKTLNYFYINFFENNIYKKFELHNFNNKNEIEFFNKTIKKNHFSWINFYFLLNNSLNVHYLNLNKIIKFSSNFDIKNLNFNNIFINFEKIINYEFFIKKFLITQFSSILPVFNFFIYNTPKNIKKNSKNKLNKYKLIWKYVIMYKRIFVAMKLIIKDIKYVNKRKYFNKLYVTLVNLFFNIKMSFIWKSKIFTYNYIFKNYRKTLMKTLQTIRQ